ncbi:hypothetical protein [Rhodopirellula bahusiensis]|uniref:hypothetical protein n=1 Tax=Rhodopirellula bahusiensis TaxID=2014065 RepID=UPI00326355CD
MAKRRLRTQRRIPRLRRRSNETSPLGRRRPIPRDIQSMLGSLASAHQKAVKSGFPVTVEQNGELVRLMPDGTTQKIRKVGRRIHPTRRVMKLADTDE